jgi:site-specific recombinase XerD
VTLIKLHEDFCKYFLYEKARTGRTVTSYSYNFQGFIDYLKSKGEPLDLSVFEDHRVLRDFMYALSERHLNKKTIRQRMLSLKSFCKYLVREDIIPRNPFDRFDIPKKEKSLPKPLKTSDMDRLLSILKKRFESSQNVRDLQAVVMVELGCKAGLRKGAMQNMSWEGTDLEAGCVYVTDKGQKEKSYPLVPSVVHWLKRLKSARGISEGPVFLSPKSRTPISDTSLHDEFKRYVRLAGLNEKEISLHSLRHTFGTTLYRRGLDIRDVQDAMGHEDISSTLGYVEVSRQELREKVSRVFYRSK